VTRKKQRKRKASITGSVAAPASLFPCPQTAAGTVAAFVASSAQASAGPRLARPWPGVLAAPVVLEPAVPKPYIAIVFDTGTSVEAFAWSGTCVGRRRPVRGSTCVVAAYVAEASSAPVLQAAPLGVGSAVAALA